ncbi:MAG: hypothetical protein JNL65_09200 [Saprospiraceae bacterium]|nr:hypothetical protein [Saprospiraceae bacterium]HRG69399.1 hypothetical protein [Saprospiraceae bacterium]
MSMKDFFSKLFGISKEATQQAIENAEKTKDLIEKQTEESLEKAKAWANSAMQEAKENTMEAVTKIQESEFVKKAEEVAETSWEKTKELTHDVLESAQHFAEKAADTMEDLAEKLQKKETPQEPNKPEDQKPV